MSRLTFRQVIDSYTNRKMMARYIHFDRHSTASPRMDGRTPLFIGQALRANRPRHWRARPRQRRRYSQIVEMVSHDLIAAEMNIMVGVISRLRHAALMSRAATEMRYWLRRRTQSCAPVMDTKIIAMTASRAAKAHFCKMHDDKHCRLYGRTIMLYRLFHGER